MVLRKLSTIGSISSIFLCPANIMAKCGGPHLTSVVGQCMMPDHLTTVVSLIWLEWWANV